MTAHPIPAGSKARLTADTPADWQADDETKGTTFEVAEYVPALHEGDEHFGDEDAIQVAFYYGNARGGYNNVCVPADLVEVAMTAEEMGAREVPSIEAANRMVMGGLMHLFNEGAEFSEASLSGEGDDSFFEAVGHTDDGLGFWVRGSVLEVVRSEDDDR